MKRDNKKGKITYRRQNKKTSTSAEHEESERTNQSSGRPIIMFGNKYAEILTDTSIMMIMRYYVSLCENILAICNYIEEHENDDSIRI